MEVESVDDSSSMSRKSPNSSVYIPDNPSPDAAEQEDSEENKPSYSDNNNFDEDMLESLSSDSEQNSENDNEESAEQSPVAVPRKILPIGIPIDEALYIVFESKDKNPFIAIDVMESEVSQCTDEMMTSVFPTLLQTSSAQQVQPFVRETIEKIPSVLDCLHVATLSAWVRNADPTAATAVLGPAPKRSSMIQTSHLRIPLHELPWWFDACQLFYKTPNLRTAWIRNGEVEDPDTVSTLRIYDGVREVHESNTQIILERFSGTPAYKLLRRASQASTLLVGNHIDAGKYTRTSSFTGQRVSKFVPVILGFTREECSDTGKDSRRVCLVEPEHVAFVIAFAAYVNFFDRIEDEIVDVHCATEQPTGPDQRAETDRLCRKIGAAYTYYTTRLSKSLF